MELVKIEESAHLVNLLAEGDRKLEIHEEQSRRQAVLQRLAHPYFELSGFPLICRHGPVEPGYKCDECEKDMVDAQKRLGR